MALVLIENPPSILADSADWTKFLIRENASNLGTGLSITTFSLTNWDTSTIIPEIASGSIIEVGGSLYQADSDTVLTDDVGIANGTVHIKLVPSGEIIPLILTPTLTNDVLPVWDANKAGWYDGADKFLPYEMVKTSAVYTLKSEYQDQNKYVKYGILADGLAVVSDLNVDKIEEYTSGNGVNIDGVVLKDSTITATGAIVAATLNTGQGANELYGMNQNVKTTDSLTFVGVSLTGALLPRSASLAGTLTLTTTPILIARGIYSISHNTSIGSFIEMQVSSGVWEIISSGFPGFNAQTEGALIFSDGVNFRITAGSSGSVKYRKF